MVLVGTHQTNTAVEIAPRSTWGTIATGSGAEAWRRLPLISSTLNMDTQEIDDPEIGDGGFAESAETARDVVRGVLTLTPYFDLPAIWMLLGNAFGGMEGFKNDVLCNAVPITTPSNFSGTHYWVPQAQNCTTTGSASAIPPGVSARAWLSGPSLSGYVRKYTDMLPTGFTWEQTANAGPRISFPVVAGKPALALASGEAALTTIPTDINRIKWSHLIPSGATAPSLFLYGSTPSVQLRPTRFSITVDGAWDIPENLTVLGTLEQPRHNGRWRVTGEIELPLKQQAHTSEGVVHDFFVNTTGNKLVIRYEGAVLDGSPNANLALEFRMHSLRWLDVNPGIDGAGVVSVRARFACEMAAISNVSIASGADYTVPIMVQASGRATYDSNATYLSSAQGGNEVPVGEFRTGTP